MTFMGWCWMDNPLNQDWQLLMHQLSPPLHAVGIYFDLRGVQLHYYGMR